VDGGCLRLLFEVGARAVAPLDDLVVKERLAEFFHLCSKLPGVHRSNAVIFCDVVDLTLAKDGDWEAVGRLCASQSRGSGREASA